MNTGIAGEVLTFQICIYFNGSNVLIGALFYYIFLGGDLMSTAIYVY